MKKIELSQNHIIEDLESPQASEMISRLNETNTKIDSHKVPKIFNEHFIQIFDEINKFYGETNRSYTQEIVTKIQ